jgi:hypothetical protein
VPPIRDLRLGELGEEVERLEHMDVLLEVLRAGGVKEDTPFERLIAGWVPIDNTLAANTTVEKVHLHSKQDSFAYHAERYHRALYNESMKLTA